jgi:ADP-L-glycero-D-manno-heptose 6-epimerase
MIVVTGGAGFIGSNLIAELNQRGIVDIAVVDRFGREEKWRNLRRHEVATVIPPDQLLRWLDDHAAEIDTIFHLGAISATTESDVDLIADSNIGLSLTLWNWCAWRGARLIYASSAATYGDGSDGFDDEFTPEALARLKPLNAYGWSKHVVDRRIARLVERGAVSPSQWVGVKFFNVYGPNEYHKGGQQSVVAHILPRIRAGEPARLFRSHREGIADGGQQRDFIWVGDIGRILLWFYDNPAVCGLYNLGTGQARSFRDLAEAVFAALGQPPRITYVDTPVELRSKYQYFTQARMERLRAAGYDRPFTSVEDGVARYVQDYLTAADPYR